MRRRPGPVPTLLLLLAAGLLAACGADEGRDSSDAPDPSTPIGSTSATPDVPTDPTGPTGPRVVDLLSRSDAGGGPAASTLEAVPDEAAAAAFATRFRPGDFADEVATSLARAADLGGAGGEVYAGVVSIGCNTPPRAAVEEVDGRYLVSLAKPARPTEQCLVPVTTVAVVVVPVG